MISILLPVYNFDIRELVKTLHFQAAGVNLPHEIVVVDDASSDKYKRINREIASLDDVVYKEESTNLGRAKIRNRLADMAVYDNLLYLDCDSSIDNPEFLTNYVKHLNECDVIYGGRKYNYHSPSDTRLKLHWMHGIKREQIPVQTRSSAPNKSFMTNNFIISREAISRVRFNERIRGYGHEDTLFGYDLAKSNITISHIDNPVIHLGLEPSDEFLRKTREGIKNLKRIMKINGNEKRLVRDITLLAYYKKIKTLHLDTIVSFIYEHSETQLRKNLMSNHPNLVVFDLYKLGYLCSLNGDTQ